MQKIANKTIIKILLLVALLMLGIIYPTTSSAWSSGSFPTSIGMDRKGPNSHKLAGNHNLYCIQRGAHLNSQEKNNYHLSAKITIEGNTATYKGKTTTNEYNGTMSYIFSGGDWRKSYGSSAGHYTARQVAVYKYWNTWVKHAGLGLSRYSCGSNSHVKTNSTVREIINKAKKYAKGDDSEYHPASIEVENKNVTINDSTTIGKYVGPFKVKYTGNIKITALDKNGKTISKIALYSYKNKKYEKIKSITSDKAFYIKNNSNVEISKLNLEVTGKVLKTKIYIISNSHNKQRLVAIDTDKEEKKADVTINIKTNNKGNILVVKEDKTTSEKLVGMKFKVKTSSGWLQIVDKKYKYNATFDKAKVFEIKDKSGYQINGLSTKEKYQVWEVATPSAEYILSKQTGYDSKLDAANLSNGKWISITSKETPLKVTYKNTPEIPDLISISGNVWEDVKPTKSADYNGLFDDFEKGMDGIQVKLMKKGNPAVEVAKTTTQNGGKYVFSNAVSKSKLDEYYVEFNYPAEYMTVKFSSTDIEKIEKNGSRAIGVNGIATTYTGTNKENEKTYGLSGNLFSNSANTGLYNESTKTLENINLGLKKDIDGKENIDQNIAYVKIKIKGYEYTYNYGGTGKESNIAAPTVSFQTKGSIRAYTKEYYPSDVVYKSEDASQRLQVKVVYRIDIPNDTPRNSNEYKEIKMHVTNLTEKFDTTRYELDDKNWTANDNIATIKEDYLKDIRDNGIEPNKTGTKYIQFNVKHDAIMAMLEHPNGIAEAFPTNAVADVYHEYQRLETKMENDKEVSNWVTYKTGNSQIEMEAPYLIFKLGKEQREIKGKVFEDNVTPESASKNEKLGNGKYDDKENIIRNVQVELLDIVDNNLRVSHLYNVKDIEGNKKEAIESDASVKTGDDGTYSFTGVVPGFYYIRYTYGDGSQKIFSVSDNKEISELSSKDYKSTIVTSEKAKEALQNSNNNPEWYKKIEGNNYSVAVDNLESRKAVNNTEEAKNVTAETAKISITVENTENDYSDTQISEDGTQLPNYKRTFDGFNFGVIKQPETKAKVEKVITNVKLVTGDDKVIFDGNPATTKMTGVMSLDLGNNASKEGSTDVRIERQDDIIYGSTLILTYGIKVTNVSDVNYYNKEYYLFGDKNQNKEVTLKVNEVMDYLDETLQFVSSDNKHQVTTSQESIGGNEVNGVTVKKQFKTKITGWDTLYSSNNNERQGKSNVQTSDTATYVAVRQLSQQDSDIEILNDAQILSGKSTIDIDSSDSDKLKAQSELTTVAQKEFVSNNDKARARAVITPPTGEDRITVVTYIMTGAITLVVLSIGIVIIKKRII